jgi:hypothetical protein
VAGDFYFDARNIPTVNGYGCTEKEKANTEKEGII